MFLFHYTHIFTAFFSLFLVNWDKWPSPLWPRANKWALKPTPEILLHSLWVGCNSSWLATYFEKRRGDINL